MNVYAPNGVFLGTRQTEGMADQLRTACAAQAIVKAMEDAPPTLCPVCALEGKQVPLDNRGVCPVQATERKGISETRRESIRRAVAQRDEGCPF